MGSPLWALSLGYRKGYMSVELVATGRPCEICRSTEGMTDSSGQRSAQSAFRVCPKGDTADESKTIITVCNACIDAAAKTAESSGAGQSPLEVLKHMLARRNAKL